MSTTVGGFLGVRGRVGVTLLLVLGVGSVLAPRAQAQTFASAGFKPSPQLGKGQTCPTNVLKPNDVVDIDIIINNQSKTGGVFVNAHIRGTTTVFLSCADPACTTTLHELSFVSCTPVGADVTSCTMGTSGDSETAVLTF